MTMVSTIGWLKSLSDDVKTTIENALHKVANANARTVDQSAFGDYLTKSELYQGLDEQEKRDVLTYAPAAFEAGLLCPAEKPVFIDEIERWCQSLSPAQKADIERALYEFGDLNVRTVDLNAVDDWLNRLVWYQVLDRDEQKHTIFFIDVAFKAGSLCPPVATPKPGGMIAEKPDEPSPGTVESPPQGQLELIEKMERLEWFRDLSDAQKKDIRNRVKGYYGKDWFNKIVDQGSKLTTATVLIEHEWLKEGLVPDATRSQRAPEIRPTNPAVFRPIPRTPPDRK
jgi:hypothetical protein